MDMSICYCVRFMVRHYILHASYINININIKYGEAFALEGNMEICPSCAKDIYER